MAILRAVGARPLQVFGLLLGEAFLLTLLGIASARAIGAVVVRILRSVLGGVLVPELATPDVEPAAEAAYGIATGLLRSIAVNVIWGAVVLIPLSWLISPTRSGESARAFLAVPFGRYPGATFALLGLVALVFLLMGAGDQRGFLVRLMIVVLAGIGAWFFRQRLVEAYPEADFGEGLSEFRDRSREKLGELWARRPKSLPGRKSGDGAGEPGAPAAKTEVLPVSPEPAAPADAETTRLDQLDRLAGMHERGVLTDEEFAEEKRRLLGGGG